MKSPRLYSLFRAKLGRDLGCSADWEESAFLVTGGIHCGGWFLVAHPDAVGCWMLGYRVGDGPFEIDREFAPVELLYWLRGDGLREFRRVAGCIEAGVSPFYSVGAGR